MNSPVTVPSTPPSPLSPSDETNITLPSALEIEGGYREFHRFAKRELVAVIYAHPDIDGKDYNKYRVQFFSTATTFVLGQPLTRDQLMLLADMADSAFARIDRGPKTSLDTLRRVPRCGEWGGYVEGDSSQSNS